VRWWEGGCATPAFRDWLGTGLAWIHDKI